MPNYIKLLFSLMYVIKGHAALNSNWLKFMVRLGVDSVRLFVSPLEDIRKYVGTKNWGLNLSGNKVTNKNEFFSAIHELRQPTALNDSFAWSNPIKWKDLFSKLNSINRPITGSNENTINMLNQKNISTLAVMHMGCSKSNMQFVFKTMDSTNLEYWPERYELYKMSYALAVWAYKKGIETIEFYNEPDLALGECLNVEKFKDYYQIRSLSIQNAYEDLNKWNQKSTGVRVAASAFARKTFGNDTKRYLGDVCVNSSGFKFASNEISYNWSNMQLYSYHSYGKTG